MSRKNGFPINSKGNFLDLEWYFAISSFFFFNNQAYMKFKDGGGKCLEKY